MRKTLHHATEANLRHSGFQLMAHIDTLGCSGVTLFGIQIWIAPYSH